MKAVVSIANNIDGDVTSMAHAEEMTYGTSYSNTASSFTKLNTTSGFSQSGARSPKLSLGIRIQYERGRTGLFHHKRR